MAIVLISLKPKEFQLHIKENQIFYECVATEVGEIEILSTNWGIFQATFKDTNQDLYNKYSCKPADKTNLKRLILVGTPFQIQVWKATLKIPKGQTRSYQDIARYIEHPQSWRAVANALGSNKIVYFVPCHRVVSTGKGLGGYRWGLAKKIALLSYEFSGLSGL